MALHNFARLKGTLVEFTIDSTAVSNDIVGDATIRRVAVYLPEGYDESDEEYPVFVDLVGLTGSALVHFNWRPWSRRRRGRVWGVIRLWSAVRARLSFLEIDRLSAPGTRDWSIHDRTLVTAPWWT